MESKENKHLSPTKHMLVSVSSFFQNKRSMEKLVGSKYEEYLQRNSASPDSRKID